MSNSYVPKVYCAGKISPHDWRHALGVEVDMEDWPEEHYAHGLSMVWWGTVVPREAQDRLAISPMIYTGPYFVRCDHSCTHASQTHAITGGCVITSTLPDYVVVREQVMKASLQAIRDSDVVYAWLDDPTAHGTIAELAYAVAMKKQVIVASPPCSQFAGPEYSDVHGQERDTTCQCARCQTWFPHLMATRIVDAHDPIDGLRAALLSVPPRRWALK